eukprot:CAMPEP_0172872286 /NCGR_PEP_ID=MMETSP1075-20121228/92552_1 /TAXON_ID=2916 /ORGANISM="Ceratium fusus, Strain PA161109" /LENGTH=55 /DNA_ID=CAMNT_0013722603 /DNA_START=316 /DNA_END=480 /DNA_ORIENTATION=-
MPKLLLPVTAWIDDGREVVHVNGQLSLPAMIAPRSRLLLLLEARAAALATPEMMQ